MGASRTEAKQGRGSVATARKIFGTQVSMPVQRLWLNTGIWKTKYTPKSLHRLSISLSQLSEVTVGLVDHSLEGSCVCALARRSRASAEAPGAPGRGRACWLASIFVMPHVAH